MDCAVNQIDHSNLGWQTTNIKKTCAVTALFISTVVLGALAYYAPITYTLATLAITAITPALIAKLFSQAKTPENAAQLTKKVILILAISGVFYAGAAQILTYYFAKDLLASIVSYNVQSFVLSSFCLSGVLGYLGPFAYNALKRVVDFTTSVNSNFLDDYLLERIENPTIAPKGILENFFFFLALVQPDEMKGISPLLPNSTREAILIFNLDKLDLQGQFKEVVDMLKSIHLYGTREDRAYAKSAVWPHMCRILKNESGDIQYSEYKQILSYFSEWKNSFLSNKERDDFLNSFKDLRIKLLKEVGFSLDNIEDKEKEFGFLEERIKYLKDNAKNLKNDTSLQKELETINSDFINLQKMLVQQASTCKCYASVWVVSEQHLKNKIERIHQLTKKFLELQDLTRLNSIVKSAQDELDETDAVWNFLLTVCSLPAETLLEWLEVTEYSQIDPIMEKLGLNTVKDLFDKNIISKDDLSDLPKVKEMINQAIRIGLHPPVEPTKDLRSQFYSVLSSAQLSNPLFGKIGRASAYAFYRLTMTFCVLAPAFVFPEVAAVGFVAGVVCFGPMSFITQRIVNSQFIQRHFGATFSRLSSLFIRRNLLTYDDSSRSDMNTFLNSGFLGKLRIFNFEMFWSLMSIHFRITGDVNEPQGAGSLIQGFVLGREVIENIALGGRRIARALNMIA